MTIIVGVRFPLLGFTIRNKIMGIDYSLYIGAYVEVSPKVEVEMLEVFLDKSGGVVTTQFDPDTGEEHVIGKIERKIYTCPEQHLIDTDGAYEQESLIVVPSDIFDDPLSQYKYLIDNRLTGINKEFELSYGLNLTSEEINHIMEHSIPSFKEDFKEQLEILQEGFEKVEIKAGMFLLAY